MYSPAANAPSIIIDMHTQIPVNMSFCKRLCNILTLLICLHYFIRFSSALTPGLLDTRSEQPNFPKCGNYNVESVTIPSLLGMDPHWDDASRSVYFTDVFGIAVKRYFIDSGAFVTAQIISTSVLGLVPELLDSKLPGDLDNPAQFPAFLIPSNVPEKFVMNVGDELGVLSWDGKSPLAIFRKVIQPDPTRNFPRFTLFDGRVGPCGRLFFWSVALIYGQLLPVNPIQSLTPANQSSLFVICGGKLKVLIKGLTFGNGVGFSPDGKTFYYEDSARRIMYKADYDQACCSMKNMRVFLDFGAKKLDGVPDGLTVDSKGYIFVTCVAAGQILKLDPKTGNVVCRIEVPTNEVHSCTFGRCPGVKNGPLDCLYATTGIMNTTQLKRPRLPGPKDGSLLLISNLGAQGILNKKIDLTTVENLSPSCYE